MNEVNAESPRRKARLAGLFYALDIVTGALSLFFAGRGLGTLGDASNLVATVCYVAVVVLFFPLFKPVDGTLSLIAACIGGVGCAFGALAILDISPGGISPLVFFGTYCILIGYLIVGSTFLPPVFGVMMMIGGLGWLTFLSPALAGQLKPWNMLLGVIAETALTVWLLAKGVSPERWRAQASARSP